MYKFKLVLHKFIIAQISLAFLNINPYPMVIQNNLVIIN